MEEEKHSKNRKSANHLRLVSKEPPVSFIPQERPESVFSLIQQELETEAKTKAEAAALIALFQTSPELAAEKLRKLREAQDPVAREVLQGLPSPYSR